MKVSIIGTGYVGLVTGACLARQGHFVTCVDLDAAKVSAINSGLAPIHEAGLPELLQQLSGRNLVATTDLTQAVLDSDLTIIAVGTPFDGRSIDLSYVKAAAQEIGTALRQKDSYHLVAVKSTVVPGTTEEVVLPILEAASGKAAGADFGVGMNPEFLTEGQAIQDFLKPDRIVIGGIDQRTIDGLAALYESFPDAPVVRTNPRTAEMIKYASNAMLATAISFSNEIANLCSALGDIDVTEVMTGLHLSHYLSPALADGTRVKAPLAAFYEAGCGYGGSCLPKDTQALVAHGRTVGQDMPLIEAVIRTNGARAARTVALLDRHFTSLTGLRVAVLGLAFKPDTDDVRESPALPIIRLLLERGARVSAYDPVVTSAALPAFPGQHIDVRTSLLSAIEDADAIVLVTRWSEFKALPTLLDRIGRETLVVDGRRMLDRTAFTRYEGIGWRRLDTVMVPSGH